MRVYDQRVFLILYNALILADEAVYEGLTERKRKPKPVRTTG